MWASCMYHIIRYKLSKVSKVKIGHPQERVVKKVSEKKGWARGTKHMLSGWKESSLRKTPQTYHCFQWRIYIGSYFKRCTEVWNGAGSPLSGFSDEKGRNFVRSNKCCWRLNSHCFSMIGMVLNLLVGIYTPKDSHHERIPTSMIEVFVHKFESLPIRESQGTLQNLQRFWSWNLHIVLVFFFNGLISFETGSPTNYPHNQSFPFHREGWVRELFTPLKSNIYRCEKWWFG